MALGGCRLGPEPEAHDGDMWPADADALTARQRELAAATPARWRPSAGALSVGACWTTFQRGRTGPGAAGDLAWAAAPGLPAGKGVDVQVGRGAAGAPYAPGMLALRVGALLEQVLREVSRVPDVVLLDGTGRDHPRRAGLALHLGAELDVPTVGITHRPLLAHGDWP